MSEPNTSKERFAVYSAIGENLILGSDTSANVRRKKALLLGSLGGLDGLDQLGNDLEQVAGDAVVGNLEDGSGLVLVDGDDALGILHASLVLDGAGDTQSNIDLGMDGLAGLADLVVSGDPTSVHAGTRGTHDAAQDLSQLLGQLDALIHVLGDTTANGHDEVSTDQVNQLLGGLDGLGDWSSHVCSSDLSRPPRSWST